MTDKFNRKIEYARISVTDRFKYCMPASGVEKISHEEILTFEEILRVVKIFSRLGIKKIRLTGGEPLLRKNICELVTAIKKIPEIEKVVLTTNGVLLKDFAQSLTAAGIDGINLSLDTLGEKIFAELTRRNFFEKVLDGLKILLEKNLPVKINCVSLRGVNDGEILKLVELAKNNPVKVRFIELMPIGCAKKFSGVPTAEIFNLIEKSFGALTAVQEKNYLDGPAKYFSAKNWANWIY